MKHETYTAEKLSLQTRDEVLKVLRKQRDHAETSEEQEAVKMFFKKDPDRNMRLRPGCRRD